ncbi:MAG TPA: helix-turn-helix domain-containing protein [Mucilaginibacter sp.]|jgi:AraC-like DNA-binding protein
MTIHFNLFNIILLFGALQGLILSLVLLFSRSDKRQNRYFLSAFMLVLAYNSFGTFCWSSGFSYPFLDFFDSLFPYTFIFTVGSSFYLYIKTTTESERIPSKTIFKTYLPGLTDFIFRICLLIYAILKNSGLTIGPGTGKIDSVYEPIARGAMVVIFWYYLISAIRLFRNWSQQIDSRQTPTEQMLTAKWTKILLIAMTLIAAVWAITIFGSLMFNIRGIVYFAPIEIILVIFVYWIGLKGYQQTRVIYIKAQKATKINVDNAASEEAKKYVSLIKRSMDIDKLYLDPELTVNKVAEHLDISPKLISAVLNGELKKGFSAFVNEYRINEVKERMLHPENKHITLAGLALESGFNSVATFQRVFKVSENMTPKEFLSQNRDGRN